MSECVGTANGILSISAALWVQCSKTDSSVSWSSKLQTPEIMDINICISRSTDNTDTVPTDNLGGVGVGVGKR